jgi:hypothetical protein
MFVVTLATFTLKPQPPWYGPLSWVVGFSVPIVLAVIFFWRLGREIRGAIRYVDGLCPA